MFASLRERGRAVAGNTCVPQYNYRKRSPTYTGQLIAACWVYTRSLYDDTFGTDKDRVHQRLRIDIPSKVSSEPHGLKGLVTRMSTWHRTPGAILAFLGTLHNTELENPEVLKAFNATLQVGVSLEKPKKPLRNAADTILLACAEEGGDFHHGRNAPNPVVNGTRAMEHVARNFLRVYAYMWVQAQGEDFITCDNIRDQLQQLFRKQGGLKALRDHYMTLPIMRTLIDEMTSTEKALLYRTLLTSWPLATTGTKDTDHALGAQSYANPVQRAVEAQECSTRSDPLPRYKGTTNMSILTRKTYVYGQDVALMTDEQLLSHLERIDADRERIKKLVTSSKALKKRDEQLTEARKVLIEAMDAKDTQ